MENMRNAGYEIMETIKLSGRSFVVGYNGSKLAPYVTWEKVSHGDKTYFTHGDYFTNGNDALFSLFRRAVNSLPQSVQLQLAESLITDEMRRDIVSKERLENMLEDIECGLYTVIEQLDMDSDIVGRLMHSDKFVKLALHRYDNIDHSEENEALSETLENLLKDEFKELFPQKFISTIKISPEEKAVLDDVLCLTADEIKEKYGDYEAGSSLLHFDVGVKSPFGNKVMSLFIEPKEHFNAENSVLVALRHSWSKEFILSERFSGLDSIEQMFSITDKDGITWSIDLHADERLRRVGQKYVFQTGTLEPDEAEHNNEVCTVLRPLTKEDNVDILADNFMWEVQFTDGGKIHAFDHELSYTPERSEDLKKNPEQQKPRSKEKLSLNEIIYKANTEIENCQRNLQSAPDFER